VYSVVVAVLGVVVGGRVLVVTGLVRGAVPLLLGIHGNVDVDGVEVGFTSLLVLGIHDDVDVDGVEVGFTSLLLLVLVEGVAEGRVCGIVVE
jgi:hypothetical protein